MSVQKSLLLELLLLFVSLFVLTTAKFNPAEFPRGFYFGAATSAYQVEGTANTRGRGPSVWDTFTHDQPERISDGSNGDVAVDFYNRYKEDLKRMKEMGFNSVRFSISWPRIVPYGKISSGVNEEGIKFYSDLIDEALANDLEPFVTIFHWDTPQALEDKYGGFLSSDVVADFRDYAELCFQRFGARVKYWVTINEPLSYATNGYNTGQDAPGRCSSWVNRACQAGDSATEPYIVSHNLLLSHAEAVKTYKQKYQASQEGKIGIVLCTWWMEPFSSKATDNNAAKRLLDFWYLHPLTYGDYPKTMQDNVKERLPLFTEEQSDMLRGSFDFLGINYYTARYAANIDDPVDPRHISFTTDARVNVTATDSEGNYIGPLGGIEWLRVVPFGLRYLLNYTKDNYENPDIYVMENGIADEESEFVEDIIHDRARIEYHDAHLGNLSMAMKEHNVSVKGYFAWSFMDNFEWSSGYSKRFGLTYIDYTKNLTRIPKDSYRWFSNLLTKPRNEALDVQHLPL
ncbi:hypothetical protein Tsubulata_035399 [Turnera subulata]|uniref:Beta-glucosidase n=1 Tax=Turnera subulata TaxID=218843 RepID=A0A9Q0G9S0_9ROSI|nr:hypothetical protein Tsubulata_035399 [Turnera subulata]